GSEAKRAFFSVAQHRVPQNGLRESQASTMKRVFPVKQPVVKNYQQLTRFTRFIAWWAAAGLTGFIMLAASAVLYISPKLPTRESYTNIRLENPLRIFTTD